jgi:hypothetical protein
MVEAARDAARACEEQEACGAGSEMPEATSRASDLADQFATPVTNSTSPVTMLPNRMTVSAIPTTN